MSKKRNSDLARQAQDLANNELSEAIASIWAIARETSEITVAAQRKLGAAERAVSKAVFYLYDAANLMHKES